ncbi:amino acid adenylation domain-containing protein, partial [Streptomyces sp. NPDC096132]|uniref:amino acid adenylation domain-containing protein n=1 Tax=Streptomyces sp. NPDC096132 TaxID=3366075 RepID=UPI00381566E0
AIPVNHNGKTDTDALPLPTAANTLRPPEHTQEPLGGQTEPDSAVGVQPDAGAVRDLFEDVLDVRGLTPDDSFFAVGGDSILALNLCAAAQARGLALELADVYALQTPRALAAAAGSGRSAPAVPAAAPFSLIGPADRALLPADGVEDAYPLAALQGGVLFHSAYGADRNMYCDVFLFRLRTEFDRLALERAIDRAVRRHDILRSSFHFSGFSEPLQLVHTSVSASVTVKDLRGLTPERQDAELEAWLDREATQPYDWSNPPLMRFTAHLLGEREWALWFGFHDALLDGWSESSLLTEILTDYWALRTDPVRPAARRLSRRFADFVALEQAAVRDEDIRQFWARELAGVEPMLLPRLAAGDPDVHRGRIGFLSVDIVPELSGDLDAVAGARGVTLKHVLLAAHARVQAALNARDEVLIGVESNGRVEEQDGSEVLGTHLNVVPYRLATRDRSWDELIDAAWAKENELLAHRRFPYAELQRLAGVPELTDILFNYTHFHTYESLAATGIEILDAKGYNRTNLTLRVEFNKDPFTRLLSLDIEANLERVTEEQLRTVGELYRNALTSLAADARAVPRQPALLGEERTHALIDDGRGPRRSATAAGWFERFDRAVAEHHDSAAAVCGAGTLSYGELAARVGSMAGWLHHRGVRRGSVVGLGSERGLGHLVTVLAVLRVGAVYLPLPAGPTQRVGSMLRRSGCDFVLCDGVWRDPITEAAVADGVPVADLTTALAEAERHESYDGPAPQGRDSAYALFTSGSTGEPKGALIRHDGMLNHIEAKIDVLSLGPGDRVSQDAAATFDISVWQWLAPLAVGATTVIYPDEIGQDPPRLLRALAEDAVTVLEVTPSVLNVMRAELEHYGVDAFPRFALRWVASQAETLTPQHANAFRRLLPGVRLLNMWGATEISDDCTHYEVRGDADERTASVPIGRPIANSAVYVLDDDRAPVPPGTPGELYAAGVCVGAGYLNDKERSAESFVPDPFSSEPGALMYRTGDRGRRLADGNLEFLGRSDNQLKIRGQRVELDEITAALAALAEVAESAVIVRENGDGGKQLVGFYVPEVAPTNTDTGAPSAPVSGPVPRLDVTPPQVRAGLAKVLPRFAVPDFLIRLDRMPRTTHGKLDTRELHRWDVSAGAGADAGAGAAASATEAAVLEVWEPILKVGTLSSSANFFEFGGHSLQATQAVARLRDRFGLDLPVRILFEQPTARDLAARIDALLAEGAGSAADDAELRIPHRAAGMAEFPLSHSQSSLWFLHQYDPDDRSYETGSLLYLSGLLDVEALRAAVAVVAERHEILSVRFGSRDGVPYQTPLPEARLRLEVEDIAVGESVLGDPGALLALAREHHRRRRFDLEKGPLAVAQLWRFSPTEHVLEWSVHHILSDGWSNVVALHEVQQAYHAHQEARPANLPALDVQYADYALWQREFLTASPRAEAELAFWRQYLDGYDGDLGLVTDMERSDDRSREAGHAGRVWDRATSERIRGFAREQGVTPFMLFHTVTAALTAKLGQRSDVVLGAAVAGRAVHGTEHLVGFFANTLPFRYHVDVSGTVADLLATVRENVLNGFEHQLAPFQEIVKSAGVPRHTGVPPLVQVFVTVDDYALDADGFPGLSVIHEQLRPVNSLFDLVFEFVDRPALELTVRYDTSLFGAVTADRLLTAFGRLLD